MADKVKAARAGDLIIHTSVWAEILSVVAQGVIYAAATAALVAAAPCTLVAAVGATAVAVGAGLMLGAATSLIPVGGKSITEHISDGCDAVANLIFPPEPAGAIASGSDDTAVNALPAARAAGYQISDVPDAEPVKPGVLETLGALVVGLTPYGWYQAVDTIINPPVVTQPNPGTIPAEQDEVACTRHPPMPLQYIAEGSREVFINSQPAARDSERTTCEGTINADLNISPDVRIGGESLVVREIRSGKNKLGMIAGLIIGMLLARKVAGHRCKGNPVSVSTGSKFQNGPEDVDFTLPGTLPIEWARQYNSEDIRTTGLFGPGWSVFYDVEIVRVPHPDGGDLWVYIDAQGSRLELGRLNTGDSFVSILDGLSFYQLGDGLTVVEDIHDGLYQIFETDPHNPQRSRLVRLGDRNRNTLNLMYDETARLVLVVDPVSHLTVHLHYDALHTQRVSQVDRLYLKPNEPSQIERREPLVTYRYTHTGNLSTVLDASGQVVRRFTYTPEHYLSSHTLPSGATRHYQWATFAVPQTRPQPVRADGTPYTLPPLLEPQPDHEWRVIRHWGSDGEDYQFSYDLEKGETRVVDSLGRTDQYFWGPLYEVYKHIDPLGHCWRDDMLAGQLLKTTDPQGGEWHYAYDEIGRLIETRDPLGRSERLYYTEHWALPLSITDRGGRTHTYRYDERGNLLNEQDPLGHTTHYRYDAQGRVVSITDATGKHKTLDWNTHSQLLSYRDCSNAETHYRYDARGQLSQSINARGESQHYRYDRRGLLIESERPDGRLDRYERDSAGQITAYTDPAQQTTRYQYDLSGRVKQRTDALGHSVRLSYDAYGRLQKLTNENNEAYAFGWDALDRLVAQRDLDNSGRCYHYNAVGDVSGVDHVSVPADSDVQDDDCPPLKHRFERDAAGRLIQKTTADGVTDYTYDAADNLLSITFTDLNGQQQPLSFSYDKNGQLLSETSTAGELQYHYDELGNLETLTLPDQRAINHLYYGSGHLHQINLNGRVICDFERDNLHDEVLRTQGQLHTRTRYDRNGRVVQKALHYHNAAREELPLLSKDYQYDACDNLIAEVLTQTQRRSNHNSAQEPVIGRFEAHNSNGKSHTLSQHYRYDPTERMRQHYQHTPQAPGQHSETFNYDAAANLMQTGVLRGHVKLNRVQVFEDKRYRYDRLGRLSEKRIGSHTVQRFEYDAEQRLIRVQQTKHGEHLRIHYQYDPLGRRIGKQLYRNDDQCPYRRTEFQWQGLRLLQEVQDGRPSLYLYANIDSYEPLARLDGKPGHEEFFYFHTNLAGLPEQLTDEHGLSVWHSEFQAWGNSRDEWHRSQHGQQQNLRFQGQYLDRETGLHYNTFRFYDPDIGRFTQPDPIGLLGGINLYQYAPNAVGWVDPWGLTSSNTGKIKLNPGEMLGNPKDINFSQVTINSSFDTPDGKKAVQSVVNQVKSGDVKVTDFPAIEVIDVKGQLVARDGNSRLAIAVLGKAKQIKYKIITEIDLLRDFTKRLRNNGLRNNGTSKVPKCKG